MMKAYEFVNKLKDIADNYDTLYIMGCFGALLTEKNYDKYMSRYAYNQQKSVQENFKKAAEKGTVFGFDCVCTIKSVLWGWNGDAKHVYGGAKYESNGVPDIGANRMIEQCTDVSTDFSNITVGEFVWMKDHCGVYVGDGLAIECTPKWTNNVQYTAVGNIGKIKGYNTRTWTKHGKLPYVDYSDDRFLYKGSQGVDVAALQVALISIGYSCGTAGADGIFGRGTEIAVKNYQSDCGLEKTGYVTQEMFDVILACSQEVAEPELEIEAEAVPEIAIEQETEIAPESTVNAIAKIAMKIFEIIKSIFNINK